MSDPTIAIIIATFGHYSWRNKAVSAYQSAEKTTADDIRQMHKHLGHDLAQVRNMAAAVSTADWLIFLDGDDMVAPDYVTHMRDALYANDFKDAIYRPSTQGFYPDGTWDPEPAMIPKRDLFTANYIIIGSMVRRDRFLHVGGFDSKLPILEDWDLWLRLHKTGSDVIEVPNAVYCVGVNEGSRNTNPDHHKVYREIRKKHQKR